MDWTAGDIMRRSIHSVGPETTLPELEQELLRAKVSGFPVVEEGRLVGIVSRADIVRQICAERKVAESTSDYYRDETGFHEVPMESFEQVASRVGERIESLLVKDVMSRNVISVRASQPLREAAQQMVEHHVHRLPVVDEDRLVGILSSLDLVRLFADGKVRTD